MQAPPDSSSVELQDDSGDRRYFVIVPQIVWALCRDVYDLSLWHTIKMIAGEDGECFLGTTQLATLSMMSAAKVHDCRQYLLEVGLLTGEIRRDPDYPQAVWHLSVPDLWRRNLEWRKRLGDKLTDRIQYKAGEHSPDEKGESIRPANTPFAPRILHSPHKCSHSPGESKKIQDQDPEVKPKKENPQLQQRVVVVSENGNGSDAQFDDDATEALELLEGAGVSSDDARNTISANLAAGWDGATCLECVAGWLEYAASPAGSTINNPGLLALARLKKRRKAPEVKPREMTTQDYIKAAYPRIVRS